LALARSARPETDLRKGVSYDTVHRQPATIRPVQKFPIPMSKKNFDKNNVEAGREFVKAYVEYIHCVEAIYQRATKPVHGHYPEDDEETVHTRKK
jgi:hypothetical protein